MTGMPWDHIIGTEDKNASRAAGFGRSSEVGKRPALLLIDIQYRTVGTVPRPFWDAIKEFPTSCGERGWAAVEAIKPILENFRAKGWPVIYPHVAPKMSSDRGRLAEKAPALITIPLEGYRFVDELAPSDRDVLIPKKHPSAFFGTTLVSHLIDLGVDTLVMTGCTTSGCIRASVIDAFSYNFRVVIPYECVYDRNQASHAVNLYDMNEKYAEVVSVQDLLCRLEQHQ